MNNVCYPRSKCPSGTTVSTVFLKLRSSDPEEQDYVFHYFIGYVEDCFDVPPSALILAVKSGLRAGDMRFKDVANGWRFGMSGERDPEDKWCKAFAEALANFKPRSEVPELTEDDIPF